MRDKWYESADTLKQRVRHLSGHRRLGPKYTKCGKRLGIVVKDERLAPCQVCEDEAKTDKNLLVINQAAEEKLLQPEDIHIGLPRNLRDEFAMHAPPMPDQWYSDSKHDCPEKHWAFIESEWRYFHADQMLSVREKRA